VTATARPETAQTRLAPADHPILFFDGVCGLCNASVDALLKRDRSGALRFAPLQGETAARLLPEEDIRGLKSLVLIDSAGVHRRSGAVVRVLRHLGGRYRFYGALLWTIPRPLRDLGYRVVSRLRYRLFGKKETCRLPTPKERERFLP
jgi:predicted DCC family thiol-disulfide oxidoreductase YuxK